MKVTKTKGVIVIGFVGSSLLLAFAANCSFEKQAGQQAKEDYYDKSEEHFVANPYCQVCHLNFEEEELAFYHESAGIGCERCHGESERHGMDEQNITPPDIMYPKARINPSCMMCHPRQNIQHVESHEVILARKTLWDSESETDEPTYCTDCHGKHHMNVRTIRWNKATGELIKTE